MMIRLRDNPSIVMVAKKFYCDPKKLDGLCDKCAVWLVENGMMKKRRSVTTECNLLY